MSVFLFLIFGAVFVLTMGYFFLMFFFPEWVGISGDDTKKAIEAHQEEMPSESEEVPSSEE